MIELEVKEVANSTVSVQPNAELGTAAKATVRGGEPSLRFRRAADRRLIAKLEEFYNQLCAPYVNVEEQSRAIALAFIAKEHVLFVGETGDAKSSLAERAVNLVDATVFKIQLNQFSLPEQLLGPHNAKKLLEEGVLERVADGKIQLSNFAYIDELFRADAILDLLLEILNERKAEGVPLMLRSVISASNFISYDDHHQALYDRYALRYFIPWLPLEHTSKLLDDSWDIEFKDVANVTKPVLNLEDLDHAYELLRSVDRTVVRSSLLKFYSDLETNDHIHISNRRKHLGEKIVAANALLNGRTKATMEDLLALKYVIPYDENAAMLIKDRLVAMITPLNHIEELKRYLNNLAVATASLKADIHNLKNIEDIEQIRITKSKASAMLEEYADPELKKIAKVTLVAADKLLTKMEEAAKVIAAEEKAMAEPLVATVRNADHEVS
ncbi:MAG: MoxR family ATPase [Candidatus Marsarchaeota archaeon]|nr:MoxR family ATPase [Candidatus Marsarchaeota archaeon]MCL5413443.1 MoxR family ATPase [Candidatus Marsarchaeota archaeon]